MPASSVGTACQRSRKLPLLPDFYRVREIAESRLSLSLSTSSVISLSLSLSRYIYISMKMMRRLLIGSGDLPLESAYAFSLPTLFSV